jgi:hypothetical protein
MAVTMTWPAICRVITQQYGNKSSRYVRGYHTGLDIGCRAGSPIYAAHDGTVILAGWAGAYGNTVEIRANDSLVTSYHHMSKIAVSKGQNVSAGKVIGYIGSTGMSTGPHLHFEVRIDGKDVNPNPYLSGASTIEQTSYNTTPVGFSDVFKFPGVILDTFEWLSDTNNWYRIGMVIGGAVLLFMTFVGIAKASALGKTAVNAVASAGKKAVKSNAKP